MATRNERLKTIMDALTETDTPVPALNKIRDAFAFTYRRGETLNNQQASGVVLIQLKRLVRQITRDAIRSQAAAEASARSDADVDLGTEENS